MTLSRLTAGVTRNGGFSRRIALGVETDRGPRRADVGGAAAVCTEEEETKGEREEAWQLAAGKEAVEARSNHCQVNARPGAQDRKER